jgi:integrase
MKGSIQPGIERGQVQVCPACKSRFVHADPKTPISPLFCPKHPDITPTRYRAKFGAICRHFDSYRAAEMELVGLNYKRVEGEFDARDYQVKAKPLAFGRLADEWLAVKKATLRPGGHRPLRNAIERAARAWGHANIKSIAYAQIEDLITGLSHLAPKTRKMTLDALKQFWAWANDRYNIPLVRWPKIGHVEMALRATVDRPTQTAIIDDIKAHEPFRVWLCVKWLATYPGVRPGEMRSLTEGQVDRAAGRLIIPDGQAKEKRAKTMPLTAEDLEIARSLPLPFSPDMPFFRHESSKGGIQLGGRFGVTLLNRIWRRACRRLGISGVPIYPGTKHSTVVACRAIYTPEQIQAMTQHRTGAAFRRYFPTNEEALRDLLEGQKTLANANSDHGLTTKKATFSASQIFDFPAK